MAKGFNTKLTPNIMSYDPFTESIREDFLRSNEKLIRKATLRKNILRVVWGVVTIASLAVFYINWFAGIFVTALAFMITGFIVQEISGRDYDKIVKNVVDLFREIEQYNSSDIKENLLAFDMFARQCNGFSCCDQFVISDNSKSIDVHTLTVTNYYRKNKHDYDYTVWEGQVIEIRHDKRLDYQMTITNSDAFKPQLIYIHDQNLVPFCGMCNVTVSDLKIFEDWSMPGLNDVVQLLASMDISFTIIISGKSIVVAIDDQAHAHFFDPVLWTADVRKNLIRDIDFLSKIVEVATTISKLEIIENEYPAESLAPF